MDIDLRIRSNRLFLPAGCLIGSLAIGCVALFSCAPAFADGFRNPLQDAAAMGQGNAFAAQADNASAVFYNPAGITQLSGVQLAGGAQFVSVNTRFTSPTGASVRNDNPFPIGLPPPGQLFLTAKLKDLGISALGDLSAGLGVQNLYAVSYTHLLRRLGPHAHHCRQRRDRS